MSAKARVVILAWLPEGVLPRLRAEFTDFDFIDAREPTVFDQSFRDAVITAIETATRRARELAAG